jgi:Tfp pilus assembly protein PilX
MVARYRGSERGMSLLIVLLVMMLLSALMIGFMANIMADTRSSGVDRDETQAFAVAHAGMEKLTSDLAALFQCDYSPNGTQISDVAAKKPTMAGFTYTDPDGSTGYKIQFTAKVGGVNTVVATPTTQIPVPDDPTTGTTIAAGPYQGFKGLVTHYNIMVTARSNGGSEVRMRRELQTVASRSSQFGLFSGKQPIVPRRKQLQLRRPCAHQR